MRLVVIGNGIAGVTAARTVRKALPEARIQIISSESDYPYARTALMYVYMGHMRRENTELYDRSFYADNRLELLRAHAIKADTNARAVKLENGSSLSYDALLVASGSKPAMRGWPGEALPGVQGFYSLSDLEALERRSWGENASAVIVGGGLIGIELAEMLRARGIPVTMLVRENSYAAHILPPEESQLVGAEIRRHGIELITGETLSAITGSAAAEFAVTSSGRRIQCSFVGLTAGVEPNIDFAHASGLACRRGVLVNESLQASAAQVFAAGDCAEIQDSAGQRVEQLWYTARDQGACAGKNIARVLAGQEPGVSYRKGVFYNSAKFFTVEYQTYGTAGERSLLALDVKSRRSVRLYSDASGRLTGVTAMGVRLRQEVCTAWIEQGRPLSHAVDRIQEALFDPEFSDDVMRKLLKGQAALS